MPQPSRPRKGSLGYGPRTRADREVPRIRSWPDDDGAPALQGFAGYKAGMTHVVMVNDEANSPREGMEESVPVTVVETPPMYAVALRAYEQTAYGKKPVEEVWATEFHEELDRALDLPAENTFEEDAEELRALLDDDVVDDVRVITHTVPSELANIPKKKPDVMETRVGGGSLEERVEFGLDLVGEGGAHEFGDVFRAGQYTDVSGITKGKGTQGPVKRWGVQKRKGKHARQGWRRRIGNLGPWNPSRVRSTVPSRGRPATTSAPSSTSASSTSARATTPPSTAASSTTARSTASTRSSRARCPDRTSACFDSARPSGRTTSRASTPRSGTFPPNPTRDNQ